MGGAISSLTRGGTLRKQDVDEEQPASRLSGLKVLKAEILMMVQKRDGYSSTGGLVKKKSLKTQQHLQGRGHDLTCESLTVKDNNLEE